MKFPISFLVLFLLLPLTTTQTEADQPLSSATLKLVEAVVERSQADGLAEPVSTENIDELYSASVLQYGNVEPLLSWLADSGGQDKGVRGRVLAEIEVHIAAKRGDMRRASDVIATLLDQDSVAARRLDLRLWQARLFDALGDVADARMAYQGLTSENLTDTEQQMVRLRLALMGLLAETDNQRGGDAKKLIELAQGSPDIAFRNRAAIVLAVQDQYAEAVNLFTIVGEGTIRFRSASRLAEWAIRAKDRDKAIASAWVAVRSAQLKRDRRYALSLLVESYRVAQNREGLKTLIEAFAKEDQGDQRISLEMRAVWVELLRELGRHEDAIALFKATAASDSGFSVEMRRELLEMEGEAGNVDRMIASYRELISAEPHVLTWRGGLTRVLLEQGKDKEAMQLWDSHIDELNKGSSLLLSAQALADLGLDSLAQRAIERMVQLKTDHGQALLFLADLHQLRGRLSAAEATLERLNTMADMGDAVRSELASAFERVGRQDKAIEVMEAIRANRETVAEDLEMRLAWLYSEVGDEDKALEQWLNMWRKVKSIPRRRYVEDRLMTVASRLGTLADIAIGLEEKLADGEADEREAGLLVRIYTQVNDSVAASEILEEYMTQSGRNEVDRLQEKGRIYQVCNDYWNYEKVIERLIVVDPEGETEYLRQLALSMLERGKAQDARKVLLTLRQADDGRDSIGGEFEAGVLALVGMHRQAADAYRRGIAKYPDRIESYLLLANLLKDMGETNRAVSMFQYLAENADQDDLFTIAIDGLLNMEASGRVMQWARRITLERLAGRDDKNYLYQLLADLSAEVNDKAGQIRAMENSLAVSGTRRLSVLRECMDLSSNIRGGVFYSSSSSGPTNAGNQPFFAFGRRLIGLGELMPPQVFLELGQAFLADGDVVSAERTFGLARKLADERSYQRQVAQIFEKANKRREALVRYDRLLRTSPSDVALIARVAKLNEQKGNDSIACRFYERGLNLLLAQTPVTTQEQASNTTNTRLWGGNRDAYQTYSDRLLRGLLVTVPDDRVDALLIAQSTFLESSLEDLNTAAADGRTAKMLADAPRIDKRSTALRSLYFAFDRQQDLRRMDLELIRRFPDDRGLLVKFATEYLARGWYSNVEWLLHNSELDIQQRRQLLVMLGQSTAADNVAEKLTPKEMWQQLLPVWMSGETQVARRILRRVDRSKGTADDRRGMVSYVIVNGVAVARQTDSAANVSAWTRLAIQLGDEGLALTFARSQLQHQSRYAAQGVKQLFESYRDVLPADSFRALVRYAANLYRDDELRLVEYLWLVSNLAAEIGDQLPSDEQLLKMLDDGDLRLNYQFPFPQAMETFPATIRGQALEILIDRIDKKSLPRELIAVPFQHHEPLDASVSKILLDAITRGIQPALQEDYLRYASYSLPRQGKALACPANAELALAVLDLLSADNVRGQSPQIAMMAQLVQAVLLHQIGRSHEALDIVIELYDPDRQIKDYYHRYADTWAQRELVPIAPERFFAKLEQLSETPRTTANTDKRLLLSQLAQSDTLLRATYEQACKDHPTETKYPLQYERWEQLAGRIGNAIAINKRSLELKKTAKKTATSQIEAIERRQGQLWFLSGHAINGLSFWKKSDDRDIARFERQQQARAKSENTTRKPGNAPKNLPTNNRPSTRTPIRAPAVRSAGSSRTSTRITPLRVVSSVSRSTTKSETITDLKLAFEANKDALASRILRHLWRAFPNVVESPYGYRLRQKNINDLRWPGSTVVREIDEAEQRKKRRGGLAAFDPSAGKTQSTVPINAWNILAEKPFGIAEMKRILRSRSSLEINQIDQVVLALLQAERKLRGDDVVFDELIGSVRQGHVGSVQLIGLFALIEEDPTRIDNDNQFVIDELMKRMDLSQLKQVSRLAWLCGKIGQRDRSAALFTQCALLAPSQGVTFSSLLEQAGEIFTGREFLMLAERMFDVAVTDDSSVSTILDVRLEHLDAPKTLELSVGLFAKLDTDPWSIAPQKALRGVRMFAQVGQMQKARLCLQAAIAGSTQQLRSSSPYYRSQIRQVFRMTRIDLIGMFPRDGTRFGDYSKWLDEASQEAVRMLTDPRFDSELAVELLLVIAVRQAEQDAASAAAVTLAALDELVMGKAKKHELLLIDVLRLAKQYDAALNLERSLYKRDELDSVRFGDLLRDTARVDGEAEALTLLDQLLEKSLDDDLLGAAIELQSDNLPLNDRIDQLRTQNQAAAAEYKERSAAAGKRDKIRNQWSAASAAPPKLMKR
jgi:hypothetical protein